MTVVWTSVDRVLERILKLQPQSLGCHELKQNKPWFDEEYSK